MKNSNVKIFTTFIYLLLLILVLGSAAFLISQRSRLIKEAQGYAVQIVERITGSYIENGSFTATGFADDVKEAMQNFGDVIKVITIIDSQNVMQNRFRFEGVDPEKDPNPNWQSEVSYKYNSLLYQEKTYEIYLPGQTSANVIVLYEQLPSPLIRSILQFDTVFILALLILSFLAFLVIPKRDPDETTWALQSVSEDEAGYEEPEEQELDMAVAEDDLPENSTEIAEIDWEDESLVTSDESNIVEEAVEEAYPAEEASHDEELFEDPQSHLEEISDLDSQEVDISSFAGGPDELEELNDAEQLAGDFWDESPEEDENLEEDESPEESEAPGDAAEFAEEAAQNKDLLVDEENTELDLLLSEAIQEIDESDETAASSPASAAPEDFLDEELLVDDLDEGLGEEMEEEELHIFSQIAATASLTAEEAPTDTDEVFAGEEQKTEALNWLEGFLEEDPTGEDQSEFSVALLELPKDEIETVRSSFEQDLGEQAAFLPHEKGLIVALPNGNIGQGVAELQGAAARLPAAYLSHLKMGITGVSAERRGIDSNTVLAEMQYALSNSDQNNNISIFDANDQIFNWQRNNT